MSFKFAVLFLALIQVGTSAQQPRSGAPKQGRHANKQTSIIRQDALATLDSVLDQLSEIDDLNLRISLTETVVKLLSTSRPQRCRRALDRLFAKAMESRGESSTNQRELQDSDSSEIRRIIQIAAVLDKSLAEFYIKTYTEALDLKAAEPSGGNTGASLAYLKLATQLVQKDPALAVLTASRSLQTSLTPDTLVFLATLRKKDAGLANKFFISALQSCQARNARDVNELLLLYAYVFTPLRIPVVTAGGIGVLNIPEYLGVAQSYPVDTLLAKQYLETSSRLLLDSNRYLPESLARLDNGLLGDFYFISVIEGRMVEYLPRSAQIISQQRNLVANYLQASDRANAFASVERWTANPQTASLGGGNNDMVEYLVSRAEQASDTKVKSQLYFRAALAAIGDKQDKRALELVDRLLPEYSGQARQLITLSIAIQKVRDGEFTEAERLARRDDVLVRRCYVLTLIADSLLKRTVKDTYNAVRLLDDIQQLAGNLSDEKEKLSVLEGVAAAYSRLNLSKAFDLFRETIQTANKMDKFNGNVSIDQSLDIGGFLFYFSVYDREFSFFDLLGRLGESDFYQTLQEAREIRNRSLRIHSIVVVCKAALSVA